jgi:hypothetical protein
LADVDVIAAMDVAIGRNEGLADVDVIAAVDVAIGRAEVLADVDVVVSVFCMICPVLALSISS